LTRILSGKEAMKMHQAHLPTGSVSLRQVLPRATFFAVDDVLATSCSGDWRACHAGDVYFALTTADDDGHEHAAAAIKNGAVAVVAERLLPVDRPQILVRDSRVALARVCQALAGNPSRDLTTIGIAGSAGKTTTAMLIASVLEAAGQSAGVMSSLGNSDSMTQSVPVGDTPTAPEMASWLARMKIADCAAAVLELSPQALAERRGSGIRLDVAVMTNLTSHGGQTGEGRNYQRIQSRVFDLLKRSGVVVVNADDHRCRNLLDSVDRPCLTYALHADAEITASVVECNASEQTFMLSAGDETIPVRTRIIGDLHVSNCLAATAVGLTLGIELETIVRGLEAIERLPGRMERLECGQPFSVFVDGARTPEALSLTMKTLRKVTRGRVLVVYGSASNAGPARRAMAGRVLERGAHAAFLTGDDAAPCKSLRHIHDVLDGFERPHKGTVVPSRALAIRSALEQAREGDCVLLAGSGGIDCDVATEWLRENADRHSAPRRFRLVG